jgi:hypothetical protein
VETGSVPYERRPDVCPFASMWRMDCLQPGLRERLEGVIDTSDRKSHVQELGLAAIAPGDLDLETRLRFSNKPEVGATALSAHAHHVVNRST